MLHKLHRLSACVLGSYIIVHLLNHLLALVSIDAHIRFMEAFRHVYRLAALEGLLLFCAVFQVVSGLHFVYLRRGSEQDGFGKLQALSGLYLAFFLFVHISAVLFGRMQLHLDTNFYYAAAGMHVAPFQLFFLPYYFLAVAAIFVHVACALRWLLREQIGPHMRDRAALAMMACGLLLAGLIVAAFSGAFYRVTVPAAYLATYSH